MQTTDAYSKQGALDLVGRIRAYWAARGKFPHVWIEQVIAPKYRSDRNENVTIYCVRSNMVGGKPV